MVEKTNKYSAHSEKCYIDKRKLPECPKDDTCVGYDDAYWRSEGWVFLVIGILMFCGGPFFLCYIKTLRKLVGACCSSLGECCSFLPFALCNCFLACGSCCITLFPHEESGSNVDEDEYYKALRTYEDRHKLLLERVEEEKEDPPATLSVTIGYTNGKHTPEPFDLAASCYDVPFCTSRLLPHPWLILLELTYQ